MFIGLFAFFLMQLLSTSFGHFPTELFYFLLLIHRSSQCILETNSLSLICVAVFLNKYISMLSNTVIDCVVATNQTYVEALKQKGEFNAEAQQYAFNMTYEAVLAVLSEDAKEYLTSIYGDLSVYITNMIEAEVNRNK